jgi:hypothetical protein
VIGWSCSTHGGMENVYSIFVEKPERKGSLVRPRYS